jgi:hypothetical protein
MEPIISTAAITAFLLPYLQKAGEKITEKSIEILFESRKDLAVKFKELFKSEIIALNLSDSDLPVDVNNQLEAKPEIKKEIDVKIEGNQILLSELINALKHREKREINTENYFENVNTINIDQRNS